MQSRASLDVTGVREGDVLAGKYRIDKVLGVGGMGVVVAARHLHLDDKVAIKFLLPEMLDSAEVVERFMREARAAVKIKNEHVARITDVGTLHTGAPFMVMEYLDGGDLAAWVQQRGPLPIEQAIEFVLQACEGIADAHGLGIVHRDLKPANLFCVRRTDGQFSIKVLDFGISKMTGSGAAGADMSMTRTTAVMGSPLYMSPEQMQSTRDVDARTDIWAIGVILFELLAGRVPFNGQTLPEVCVTVATKPAPRLREFRPDAPVGLERAILKCLEKDREARFRNVAELALALVEFGPRRARLSAERISGIIQGSGLSVSAMRLPPSSDSHDAVPAPGTLNSWGQTAPSSGTRSGRWTLGAVALVIVAGGAGAAFFLRQGKDTQPELATTAAVAVPSAANAASPNDPTPVAPPAPAPVASSAPPAPAGSAAGPSPQAAGSAFKGPPPADSSAKRVVARPVKAPPVAEKRSDAIGQPPTPPRPTPAPLPNDLGGRL